MVAILQRVHALAQHQLKSRDKNFDETVPSTTCSPAGLGFWDFLPREAELLHVTLEKAS